MEWPGYLMLYIIRLEITSNSGNSNVKSFLLKYKKPSFLLIALLKFNENVIFMVEFKFLTVSFNGI